VNASQIVDAARRYPMMAERQVVIVKEAQNLKNTYALEKYLKQPSVPQSWLSVIKMVR
jgi:DNA polymerase-3 subunit delta